MLVVDDYDYVYHVITRMLRRAGYRVTATASAREALEAVAAASPPVDLLLTDVRMPEISGPELAERAREINPELPLLFMSGYMDFDEHTAPFGARILNKPFTMSSLMEAVQREVGNAIPGQRAHSPAPPTST